jgi:hypothetical protein
VRAVTWARSGDVMPDGLSRSVSSPRLHTTRLTSLYPFGDMT